MPERARLLGFALSLAIGVGALFGVAQLLSSLEQTLRSGTRAQLGGDLKVSSWRELSEDAWFRERERDLSAQGRWTRSLELASMAALGAEAPQLISLRAVEPSYPLWGSISWREAPAQPHLGEEEAWVGLSMVTQRGAKVGDTLTIGRSALKIVGVIEKEPDGGLISALSFAPRVIISSQTLSALELVQPGSRVRRVAQWRRCEHAPCQGGGAPIRDEAELRELVAGLQESAPEHIELRGAHDAQPNLLNIFERIGLFFSMIGLVTLSLSALSFIAGLLGLLRDQLPLMGALRSLGVDARELSMLYRQVTVLVGLTGGLLGLLIGLGLYYGLSQIAEPWLGLELRLRLEPSQALGALGLALWVSVAVNWAAQRALSRAPTQALWRAPDLELKLTGRERLGLSSALLGSLWAYLYLLSGSALLSALFTLALSALTLSAALMVWLLMRALKLLRRALRARPHPALRFVIGHLLGYRGRAWAALLSLSVGLSLITALQGVQGSLEGALSLGGDDRPQIFMVDVQDDQRERLQELVSAQRGASYESLPLIRARIASLAGLEVERKLLSEESVADKMRAKTLTREHNITTRLSLSRAERVTSGRWWSEEEGRDPQLNYLSLEERFAGRLGLRVGDELSFDIQGVRLSFTVLNLRRVDWLSMRPNFLFVASPGALEGAPRTHVASAHFSDDERLAQLSSDCARELPNVTVIDARPVFKEGRRLLGALSVALSLTGGLCALAGALLLIGGVWRDHKRRLSAVSLLSALGVEERRAWRWVTLELSLIGLMSALVMSLCALALMWGATQALQLPLSPDWGRFSLWLLLSASLAPLIGWIRSARGLISSEA